MKNFLSFVRIYFNFVLRLVCYFFILISVFYCSDDKDLEKKYNQALEYYSANKRQDAIDALKSIYSKDPEFRDSGFLLGKLYYYDLKFPEANHYFEEIRERNPEDLDALLWLIKTSFAQKKPPEKILEMTKEFLLKDSTQLEVLYIAGRMYESQNIMDKAIASYSKAVLVSSAVEFSHERLAEIYEKARIPEKAKFHRGMYNILHSKLLPSSEPVDSEKEKKQNTSKPTRKKKK